MNTFHKFKNWISYSYQSIPQKVRDYIFCCYLVIFFVIGISNIPYKHVILSIIMYIPCTIYSIKNFKQIIEKMKNLSSILSFGILYTLSTFYVQHYINIHYQIEVQYLSLSTHIFAFLYSIIFIGVIIFPYSFFKYFIFLKINPKKVVRKDQSPLLAQIFYIMVLFAIFPPLIFVERIILANTNYYILADAYPFSDCGKKVEGTWYIRKNTNECYAIYLGLPPFYETILSKN